MLQNKDNTTVFLCSCALVSYSCASSAFPAKTGCEVPPTFIEVGTCFNKTSCQLSNPRKEQTALSWDGCWARAPDWLVWIADWLSSILTQQKRHALWKLYNLQVWINFIHWFYWLIDNFAELFRWTRIPTFRAHTADVTKSTVTDSQIYGLMDVVGVARYCAYFEIGNDRKTGTFGDENVMSLVPDDIFASRDRVLR